MRADDDGNEFLRSIVHAEFDAHATYRDVRRLCLEAAHYRLGAVFIHPVHCARAMEALAGSDVRIIAAVAFPTGAFTIAGKVCEARDALSRGADGICYVVDVGALRSGKDAAIADEMRALREAVRDRPLTAVLETSVLTDEQTERACILAADATIDFIAPATGFVTTREPLIEAVRRMTKLAAPHVGIAALGEIETLDTAHALIDAGATRLYTATGVQIAQELQENTS